MDKEIHILLLENGSTTGSLVKRALRDGGLSFVIRRVETRQDFVFEIENNAPDVILSDCGGPAFDDFSALAVARAVRPGIPFIFVSGRHGEDDVVKAIKQGATDYIVKDRLNRLVPVLQRVRQEVAVRQKSSEQHEQTPVICFDALFATTVCFCCSTLGR